MENVLDQMVDDDEQEWHCPNCGETTGVPVTRYSSEFQGCREHGGMVTWEDEGCTECMLAPGRDDL